jgi:TRAP-type C4-dicarboxylate transport system permease large subunit
VRQKVQLLVIEIYLTLPLFVTFNIKLRNKMFSKECRAHLNEVQETGLEHMLSTLKVAIKLQLLVPALIIHSIAPRFFTRTASVTLSNILNNR